MKVGEEVVGYENLVFFYYMWRHYSPNTHEWHRKRPSEFFFISRFTVPACNMFLFMFFLQHKEDDPSYVVIETPKAVHQVTGVQKISETHLRVSVLKEEHGLHLVATDAADGQAWCDALERACVWDAHSSEKEVTMKNFFGDVFSMRVQQWKKKD